MARLVMLDQIFLLLPCIQYHKNDSRFQVQGEITTGVIGLENTDCSTVHKVSHHRRRCKKRGQKSYCQETQRLVHSIIERHGIVQDAEIGLFGQSNN